MTLKLLFFFVWLEVLRIQLPLRLDLDQKYCDVEIDMTIINQKEEKVQVEYNNNSCVDDDIAEQRLGDGVIIYRVSIIQIAVYDFLADKRTGFWSL